MQPPKRPRRRRSRPNRSCRSRSVIGTRLERSCAIGFRNAFKSVFNRDDIYATASSKYRADFAEAILKQGGNWIGNTGYGYGDSDLVGYSERLALLQKALAGANGTAAPTPALAG